MVLCTHRWKVSPPYLYSELDIFSIQFWVFLDKIQHPMPFIPRPFNLISTRTKGVATKILHTEPKWGTQLPRRKRCVWMQEVLWKGAETKLPALLASIRTFPLCFTDWPVRSTSTSQPIRSPWQLLETYTLSRTREHWSSGRSSKFLRVPKASLQ